MVNLKDFLFKNVVVIDTDGIKHKGFVNFYETGFENESDEDSIGILTDPKNRMGIELYQSEIKSIELA
ncbi:MAG: hypothetical protein K2H90_04910 [Oscillospiraceae bacterium]|nr:hypothetical protein [Oscillospiraceae bacterium]